MQHLGTNSLAPKLHSSWGSEESAKTSTTWGGYSTFQKNTLTCLFPCLAFFLGTPSRRRPRGRSQGQNSPYLYIVMCLLNLAQSELTTPIPMLTPYSLRTHAHISTHTWTHTHASLTCSLTGVRTLPAIPYAMLFAPARSGVARWADGHAPNGGGELGGEHALPCAPPYRAQRGPSGTAWTSSRRAVSAEQERGCSLSPYDCGLSLF